MADKKKGYVPIFRSLQDHWIWKSDEPFDKRSAWVDLLLSVNHEERKILVNNQIVVVRPGQRWTSYRTLAKQWHWSKDRVKRYIKLLKSDNMIYTDETRNGTLLTIVNWDNFTIQRDSKRDTNKDTGKDTYKDTGKDTGKDETIINKNDKELKNEKEKKNLAFEIDPPIGGGEWE